jgi:peptidoglycan/LPS O-acetylase OafA/YrhL
MLTFDALRFIAAVGIVIHHSNSFLYPVPMRTELKEASWGLALLVDLFFLISGYVIAFVYGGRIGGIADYFGFLRKRVARLFPLHLITLVVTATLYFIAMLAGQKIGTAPDLSATCLAKTALMLHAIFPCEGPIVNAVSWSISAEMLMYALFPVLFWILSKSKLIAIVGAAVSLAALAFGAGSLSASEWTEIYAPYRALPSFCFGICLQRILSGFKPGPLLASKGSFGIFWAMVALMLVAMSNNGSALLVLSSICAVCIYAAMLDCYQSHDRLLHAVAGFGRLTYGIYMIHLLVVTIVVNFIADKILHLSYWPMFVVITMTALVIGIVSIPINFWIETPLRRILSPRTRS